MCWLYLDLVTLYYVPLDRILKLNLQKCWLMELSLVLQDSRLLRFLVSAAFPFLLTYCSGERAPISSALLIDSFPSVYYEVLLQYRTVLLA